MPSYLRIAHVETAKRFESLDVLQQRLYDERIMMTKDTQMVYFRLSVIATLAFRLPSFSAMRPVSKVST